MSFPAIWTHDSPRTPRWGEQTAPPCRLPKVDRIGDHGGAGRGNSTWARHGIPLLKVAANGSQTWSDDSQSRVRSSRRLRHESLPRNNGLVEADGKRLQVSELFRQLQGSGPEQDILPASWCDPKLMEIPILADLCRQVAARDRGVDAGGEVGG